MTQANVGALGRSEGSPPTAGPLFVSSRWRVLDGDMLLALAARLSGAFILLMLAALLVVLFMAARQSMHQFGWRFFITSQWRPNELVRPLRDAQGKVVFDKNGETVMQTIPPVFGALPVIYGTAVSSALALIIAVPLSFGAARRS